MPEKLLPAIFYEYDLDNRDDKAPYDAMYNDCYPAVKIGCLTFDPAKIVEEMDPIAYRCGFNDWSDGEPERWKCPICDKVFSDEDDAKFHCQENPED